MAAAVCYFPYMLLLKVTPTSYLLIHLLTHLMMQLPKSLEYFFFYIHYIVFDYVSNPVDVDQEK